MFAPVGDGISAREGCKTPFRGGWLDLNCSCIEYSDFVRKVQSGVISNRGIALFSSLRFDRETALLGPRQSDKTVQGYLDILTETYMIRQVQPWYENLGKR